MEVFIIRKIRIANLVPARKRLMNLSFLLMRVVISTNQDSLLIPIIPRLLQFMFLLIREFTQVKMTLLARVIPST
jgi:hypothetical protein